MTDEEIIQKAGHEWDKLRGDMRSYLAIVIRMAREDEREACARIAEEPYEFTSGEARLIAAAIRARNVAPCEFD
jgi:hypothetical protein